MSTHQVHIIDISEILPHDNADSLEIIPINGWSVVVRRGDFNQGQRAVYIEPDYIVPTTRREFAFLHKASRESHRLRAIRLRGVVSFGLLIPCPQNLMHITDGVSMMEALGITRYEPPVKYLSANELPHEDQPKVFCPKFDIESFKNFPYLIKEGEQVVITEKIHGANARYVWANDRLYIGSRNRWIDPSTDSVWKAALDDCPGIQQWCYEHPETILFGEVYGRVQSLTYGLPNSVRFAAFAALSKDAWWSQTPLYMSVARQNIGCVPFLYEGPFDKAIAERLAEENSTVKDVTPGHMREGVVVVPAKERIGPSSGRTALKIISNRYWLSNEE